MSDEEWFSVRKKPVKVEARGPYDSTDEIETLEGDFEVDEAYIEEYGGYYIIRGVEGEVYPCRKDIFEKTYERVDDGLEQYDVELFLGLFSWIIVPALLAVATVISLGIAVKHLMQFTEQLLARLQRDV